MITDNLEITTPEYWDKIYKGENDNAKIDASNTKRAPGTFDRFNWVAMFVEGPNVLGVASGHAHIEKRIKAMHKNWNVVASDQSTAAKSVARFEPYWTVDMADGLPFLRTERLRWDTIVIAQALEYLKDDRDFVFQASLVSMCLVACLPIGDMAKWSQLRIYTEESAKALFAEFGKVEVMERRGDLLLVKTRFYA